MAVNGYAQIKDLRPMAETITSMRRALMPYMGNPLQFNHSQ